MRRENGRHTHFSLFLQTKLFWPVAGNPELEVPGATDLQALLPLHPGLPLFFRGACIVFPTAQFTSRLSLPFCFPPFFLTDLVHSLEGQAGRV